MKKEEIKKEYATKEDIKKFIRNINIMMAIGGIIMIIILLKS